MLLLKNADLYAPEALGHRHLLVSGGQIAWIGTDELELPTALGAETLDLEGRRVVPGFIDCHTHLTGGGGETGYASTLRIDTSKVMRRPASG